MPEQCTFYRVGRDQAKELFACKTPESLRAFIEPLPCAIALEGSTVALVLHRVLTDGTLSPEAGDYPLNHAVLGGRLLGQESGFAVVLKRPDMSAHIANALAHVASHTIATSLDLFHTTQPEAVAGVEVSALTSMLSRLANLYSSAAAGGEAVILVRQSDTELQP